LSDTGTIDGLPKVMLMTAWQERLELHDLVEKVAKTCRALKVDKLLIENKASGISVSQEMRRMYGHEDFAVQLIDPKAQDKLARLYSVQALFSEGMVYAPDRAWADMVITQVGQFPKGRHDDLCLTGDTLITMSDGTIKRIDAIVAGDMVATPAGPCLVSAASMTGVREVWQVEYTGGCLVGTANHPIRVGCEWKELSSLCPFDVLQTQLDALNENQNLCVVKSVKRTHTMHPVFNLTVEGGHCYYANGILTHNCDTVSMALRHLRDLGLLVRSPERIAELNAANQHQGKPPQPLYPV